MRRSRTLRIGSAICLIALGLLCGALAMAATEDASARALLLVAAAGFLGLPSLFFLRSADPTDIVQHAPGLAWTAAAGGQPTGASAGLLDYLGLAKAEDAPFPGDAVHPDDRRQATDLWLQSLERGEDYLATFRLRDRNGAYHWFRSVARPERDARGAIVRWHGALVNIDDLKVTEEALRVSEEGLRSILDYIPGLVSTADADGNHNYANKRCTDYYGLDSSELSGIGFLKIIHPDDRDLVAQARLHCMRTNEPMDMPHRMRRHDGAYRWFHARVEPIFDTQGKVAHWYGLFTDIDDQVRAQDALRIAQEKLSRAAQLASLAELSASIAHEVNQPLAAVVTNGQTCSRWLSADPPNLPRARIAAERIVRDSMAAAEVVSRTRALFARKPSGRAWIDFNEVIGEVRQLVADERGSGHVPIATDLDPSLPPVLADRIQMQQILLNLIRNGIEATAATEDEPKTLEVRSRRAGEMIRVEVRDNGGGIAEPGRVFEPLFTTKKEGMGMGLSICRSILEAHDGRIWAESLVPRGTMFSFLLPIQSAEQI